MITSYRSVLRTWRGRLTHPAVAGAMALLALSILPMLWVAWGVVDARGDAAGRRALEYDLLVQELDSTLRSVPTRRLLRPDQVQARLANDSVRAADTLAITADTIEVPGFAEAGFLYDEVRKFNRFQHWRAEAGSIHADWYDSLARYNPSVFRTRITSDGASELARTVAVHNLRVPSPFEDTRWMTVTARESGEGPSLLGPGVELFLTRPSSARVWVSGQPHTCRFTPDPPDEPVTRVSIHCRSALGEKVGAREQAAIHLLSSSRATVEAGYGNLRVDGRKLEPRTSAPAVSGTIIDLDPLGPAVLTRARYGVLATGQWVNGRVRRVVQGPPGLHFLSLLGERQDASLTRDGLAVQVSVDVPLSAELTDSLRAIVERERIPIDFAAVVLADVTTGELLGIGETGRVAEVDRPRFMEPVNVGSAVKPILAAAILGQRPTLATLEVPANGARVHEIFGLPMGGFENDLHCDPPASGWVDLLFFIRCSNNRYAATLALASMISSAPDVAHARPAPGAAPFRLAGQTWAGVRPPIPIGKGGMIPYDALVHSALANGLLLSFDRVADPEALGGLTRRSDVWSGLRTTAGDSVHVPRQIWPEVSQPTLVARGTAGTIPALVAAYSYGGWENRWTLLDLTEAYVRLLADRAITLSFTPDGWRRSPASQPPERLGFAKARWYPVLSAGLSRVAVDGTARGLRDAWRQQLGASRAVYAKTGTLSEKDDRIYVRTLAFGVGNESAKTGAALGCGVVGTLFFKLSALPPGKNSIPSYHTTFAKEQLGAILARHWKRLGLCAPR